MCTVTPLTVQLPVALKVTSRPDEVNAPTLKFGVPNVEFVAGVSRLVVAHDARFRSAAILKRLPALVLGSLADVTGNPDVLSAATVNAVMYVAVAGACVWPTIVFGVVPRRAT